MKIIITLTLVLILTGGASAQATLPSLADTLQWMHDFVATNGHTSSGQNASDNSSCKTGPGCKIRVDEFGFESKGCSVVTTSQVRMGINDHYSTTVDKFSLKDLDPSQISVEDDQTFWGTWVTTFNNRELVKSHTEGQNAPGKPVAMDANSTMTHIGFHSQEQANRFAKALKHAVVLCGGKSSAF